MDYKIVSTEQAKQTYASLVGYLLNILNHETAVRNLIDRLRASVANIQSNPYLYEQCRSPRLRSLGYRRAVNGRYIIVYRVAEEDHTVYISGFFHGHQNYESNI